MCRRTLQCAAALEAQEGTESSRSMYVLRMRFGVPVCDDPSTEGDVLQYAGLASSTIAIRRWSSSGVFEHRNHRVLLSYEYRAEDLITCGVVESGCDREPLVPRTTDSCARSKRQKRVVERHTDKARDLMVTWLRQLPTG